MLPDVSILTPTYQVQVALIGGDGNLELSKSPDSISVELQPVLRGERGIEGQPGTPGTTDFDDDIALIYQISKL